jgi:large subunit ribosomal protein L18
MANRIKIKRQARIHRHARIRTIVNGTGNKPRLSVFRSLNHIYTQIIDDSKGHTLVSVSTLEKEVRSTLNGKKKTEKAELIGNLVAKRALEKGIKSIVFDRGGYNYHGRIKALAEAARKAGLEF